MKSSIRRRTVRIGGHQTGVSVEDAFWADLKKIAYAQQVTLTDLIANIDKTRRHRSLSSAIRLFVFEQVRSRHPSRRGDY